MKFLIILFYYERPELLKRALESVRQQQGDWEICLIDDGNFFKARDVLLEDMRIGHKISLIEINDHEYMKKNREVTKGAGGSVIGAYANVALATTDADYALILCDDDVLEPNYLYELSQYYIKNPQIKYSYCHLKFQNPLTLETEENEYTRYLNSKTHPINPVNELDSSQISWNVRAWREGEISFPFPHTVSLDREIYSQMFARWGECEFNGIIGQTKGIHNGQLIHRKEEV